MTQKVVGFPGLYRETSSDGSSRFRIVINHNKEIIQEYFYYGSSISETAAESAAVKRWTQIRKRIPVLTKRKFMEVLRKPTASGIPGVTRIITRARGNEYEVWKATWTNQSGNRESRQFSINKYGTREAKRLAMEARREALNEIGDE